VLVEVLVNLIEQFAAGSAQVIQAWSLLSFHSSETGHAVDCKLKEFIFAKQA
jgi:hypothetical protein